MLTSEIKKIDHSENFCATLRSLGERSPEYINQVIESFTPEQKKFVSQLLQTRKVTIAQPNGEKQEVMRRVIKVKRRIQPGSQAALQQQQHLMQQQTDAKGDMAAKQRLELPPRQ